jgi:hypothetical protein
MKSWCPDAIKPDPYWESAQGRIVMLALPVRVDKLSRLRKSAEARRDTSPSRPPSRRRGKAAGRAGVGATAGAGAIGSGDGVACEAGTKTLPEHFGQPARLPAARLGAFRSARHVGQSNRTDTAGTSTVWVTGVVSARDGLNTPVARRGSSILFTPAPAPRAMVIPPGGPGAARRPRPEAKDHQGSSVRMSRR